MRADGRQQCVAVHGRHLDVGHHQIDALLLQDLDGLLSVAGLDDLAVPGEDGAQVFEEILAVVDQNCKTREEKRRGVQLLIRRRERERER